MIRVYYGEATQVANIVGCTKQVASYNIKKRNPAYLDVLYEVRRNEEKKLAESEARFAEFPHR